MSLPPLPEVFGNYAIRGIEEIIAPDAISWLPQTRAWLIVLLLFLLAAGRVLWRRWKIWRSNRYRYAALEKLSETASQQPSERLQSVTRLLKATALHAYPRQDVASLSGALWIEWLHQSAGQQVFSGDSRELLQHSQYRSEQDIAGLGLLATECALWIRCHRRPAGD